MRIIKFFELDIDRVLTPPFGISNAKPGALVSLSIVGKTAFALDKIHVSEHAVILILEVGEDDPETVYGPMFLGLIV